VSMMKQMPALLEGADANTKSAFQDKAKEILSSDLPSSYSDLKVSAIQTLAQLGSQDNVAQLEHLAVNNEDGVVRFAALQALNKLSDPELAKIVDSRLAKDPDVTVQRLLGDLKYGLESKSQDPARLQAADQQAQVARVSEIQNFISDINQRYPELSKFDDAAQSKWIGDNFPLLNHDQFENQSRVAVKEQHIGFFESANDAAKEAVDGVAAQRQEQFNKLLSFATMDPDSLGKGMPPEMLQQIKTMHDNALAVLGSVIGTRGNIISPANEQFISKYSHFRSPGSVYQGTSPDWSAQAAKALIDTAQAGRSQRDLSARYIAQALASNPTGATHSYLLQALQNLNNKINGVSDIPDSLYGALSKV